MEGRQGGEVPLDRIGCTLSLPGQERGTPLDKTGGIPLDKDRVLPWTRQGVHSLLPLPPISNLRFIHIYLCNIFCKKLPCNNDLAEWKEMTSGRVGFIFMHNSKRRHRALTQ